MIKREDLNEKMLEVIQQEMQAEITKYSAEVTTMTMEQLGSEEAKLVGLMNEYDNYLNTVSYVLEDKVEFEENTFDKSVVASRIQDFINKMELEWQYTLGMYQMHKLWESVKNNSLKEIGYKEYDSTLRVLGQVKFKGYNEWESILIVNKYLSSPQDRKSVV